MRLAVLPLLGAALIAAAPIPAPVVVDEPGGLPEGLSLRPPVTSVEVPPDGALVTHHLAVGSGARTVFDLGVRSVVAGPDGEPQLGEPTDAVRLPAGTVTLDPGERATVTSLVHGPVDGSELLALTATPRGGGAEDLVALVVAREAGTGPGTVADVAAALDDETLVVGLGPTGTVHAAVDVRVRLAPPAGPAVLDETLRDVVLWPDRPRELVWRLDLPPWPVPYTVEVVAGEPAGEVARAEVTAWPPVGAWLPAVAAMLVVVAALVWWLVRRRAREVG